MKNEPPRSNVNMKKRRLADTHKFRFVWCICVVLWESPPKNTVNGFSLFRLSISLTLCRTLHNRLSVV